MRQFALWPMEDFWVVCPHKNIIISTNFLTLICLRMLPELFFVVGMKTGTGTGIGTGTMTGVGVEYMASGVGT